MVKLTPIEHPATANWDLPLTYTDYNKLLKGFTPQDMDDKWVVVTDPPDANGKTVVHLARSWTGSEQTSLTIGAGNPHNTGGKDWGRVISITWASMMPGDVPVTEEEAKETAVNFCRGLMGCEMGSA